MPTSRPTVTALFEVPPTFERLIFDLRDVPRRALYEHPRELLRNYRLHWPLRMARALAPCSAFEADMLRQMGMPQPQTVVPLWLDVPFIQQTPVQPPVYDLPRPWLLFVGQLTPRKGYDIAIRALPAIVRAYPQVSLLIVSGINHAQKERLFDLAHSLGVEQHIHLLGYRSDAELINLYRASDALLFPTRYEGFGLPLLEAMAADCPVITTDIPVVREIVQHGDNGLLVPYDNAAALARAVLWLLGQPRLRERLIAGGRITLATRYNETHLIKQIEMLYHSVL
ncbi:MAG: glycosyltransferase family 4 protein [Chloroflexaceae bacterium]|nr:glycosyltransferase family 4 protein [Chloroflexaceae bacterium]